MTDTTTVDVSEEEVKAPTARELELDKVRKGREEVLKSQGMDIGPQEASHTIKIDGEERIVPTEEINKYLGNEENARLSKRDVIEFQKHIAADKRFNQLDQQTKELKRMEAALREREAKLQEQSKTPAPAKAKLPPLVRKPTVDVDALAAELQDAVLTEDKAKTAAILRKLMPQQQGQDFVTPDQMKKEMEQIAKTLPQAIDSTLRSNTVKKTQTSAREYFESKYSSLANSALRADVDKMSTQLYNDNPSRQISEVIDEAVSYVRSNIAGVFGEPVAPMQQQVAMGGTPRPTAARANINREAPPPLTKEQSIARKIAERRKGLY